MFIDGFKYWLAYTKGHTNYYRCSRHKQSQHQCPGRGVRKLPPPHPNQQQISSSSSSTVRHAGAQHSQQHNSSSAASLGAFRLTHPHNHPAEQAGEIGAIAAFRRVLTQRAAAEPHVSLHSIYWDEASQRHLDAAMLYQFPVAESAMRKARLRWQQRRMQTEAAAAAGVEQIAVGGGATKFEPRTVEEVDAWLAGGGPDVAKVLRLRDCGAGGGNADDSDPDGSAFYRTTLKLSGGVTCWLFVHGHTLRRLERVEQLHVDASMVADGEESVVASGFGLMVFHAVQASGSIPIVYAVTAIPPALTSPSSATQQPAVSSSVSLLYATILAYIREHFSLHIQPTLLITNFADALQRAARHTYPDSTVKGFWHEYTAALLQRVRSDQRLQRETAASAAGHGSGALRMLLVLPLLPADYMQPGLEAVRRWAADKRCSTPALQQLCAYVAAQWLRPHGAGKLSMFGVPHAVHRSAWRWRAELRTALGSGDSSNGKSGGDVSVGKLLQTIAQMARRSWQALRRRKPERPPATTTPHQTKRKPPPTSQAKRSDRHAEAIITDATEQWIRTPVHLRNPLQFLQLSSHCANELLCAAGLLARSAPVDKVDHSVDDDTVQSEPTSQPPAFVSNVQHATASASKTLSQQQQQKQFDTPIRTAAATVVELLDCSFDQLLQNDHNYYFDTAPPAIPHPSTTATLIQSPFQIVPPPQFVSQAENGYQQFDLTMVARASEQHAVQMPATVATTTTLLAPTLPPPPPLRTMMPSVAATVAAPQKTPIVRCSNDPPPLNFFKSTANVRKPAAALRRSEPPPLVPFARAASMVARRPAPTMPEGGFKAK